MVSAALGGSGGSGLFWAVLGCSGRFWALAGLPVGWLAGAGWPAGSDPSGGVSAPLDDVLLARSGFGGCSAYSWRVLASPGASWGLLGQTARGPKQASIVIQNVDF